LARDCRHAPIGSRFAGKIPTPTVLLASAMAEAQEAKAYICPMHASVRQPGPGKCPHCAMALLPEGTRLALLRHMAQNRWMMAAMVALMLRLMAGGMMLMR